MTEETADVARHVRAVELRRLAALRSADIPTLEALHAADYQLVAPGGSTVSRDDYLSQIVAGALVYRRFEPDGEMTVRALGPAAAAVRYQAVIDVVFPGGSDHDRFWHTDLYERAGGQWQVVWSQATRITAR